MAAGGIGGYSSEAVAARTTVVSIFAGLAGEATGGSFRDAALSAAIVHLFNEEMNWAYPTRGPIRKEDRHGFGAYGVSRDNGARTHAGVDYSGKAGSQVVAPHSGWVEIVDDGVRITGRDNNGTIFSSKVLHIAPIVRAGQHVTGGQPIGKIRDLRSQFPEIINHAHIEVYTVKHGITTKHDPNDFIPPYPYRSL